MSYRLEHYEPIGEGMGRVVRDQIESAIRDIDDNRKSRSSAAHDVRKHCKKVRGALRLIRCSFEDYGSENVRFRGLARQLAEMRDSRVLRDTQSELLEAISGHTSRSSIAALNEALALRTESGSKNVDGKLEAVRDGLIVAFEDAGEWNVAGDDFEALAGGLCKTYEHARKGLRRCGKETTTDNLHAWRKRVKDHWCHLRLLSNAWPKVIMARAVAGHHLSALLGDNHDLAVYIDVLDGMKDSVPAKASKDLRRLAEERREALLRESLAIGTRLFTEKPHRIAERFETYWSTWREQDIVESA